VGWAEAYLFIYFIVFRSGLVDGLVQDPGYRFWSGHWVTRVNSFFLNQNDVILVKKQKSTGCNRVFDRVLLGQSGHRVNWITPGFSFPYYFFNPARFQPRVPGQLAGSGRVSKLCFYGHHTLYFAKVFPFNETFYSRESSKFWNPTRPGGLTWDWNRARLMKK
jgi:hypothetical protein